MVADSFEELFSKDDLKNAVQHSTEFLMRYHTGIQNSQFWWVCLVALVALASAELWVGVVGVALIAGWISWRNRLARRIAFRLDRFRRRYHELLERADDHRMLAEDKEFLRKYEDSILYPLVVPEHKREAVSGGNLYHVETLSLLSGENYVKWA